VWVDDSGSVDYDARHDRCAPRLTDWPRTISGFGEHELWTESGESRRFGRSERIACIVVLGQQLTVVAEVVERYDRRSTTSGVAGRSGCDAWRR
jgi:hypothetical protein